MTKGEALQAFFSSFGLKAYPAQSVEDDAPYKNPDGYITYENSIGTFEGGDVAIVVNVWKRTSSEAQMNELVDRIADRLSHGGYVTKCDDGFIWFKQGSPWSISLQDGVDTLIKGRRLNISLEYLTKK